ncbi:MAG: Zn-dependent hydrolase [Neptuniibacter caesariensis]|uniref:Zn-dependent hydrolase n=1 Tax=Neptuniibacter caesariensis TaxID=207954 RepID=A0A2G6JBV8_NEPCE|nr:MAG: Zn-dependent hydrolase [Neptuniibacter caesariensis]
MILYEFEGYIQSIYLVEYPHGLLLLDGGCRADVPVICEFIQQQLRRPLSDLKLVVSTHMHPDHAGAATELRKLTGCKIAAGTATKQWYSGIDGILMYLTDMVLAQWVAGKKGREKKQNLWYPRKLRADVYLQDGDLLPGFAEWQVMTTHGHTDRDISLYHKNTGKIYVADLVVIVKGKYSPPFPVFHPNRYRSSLARVKSLNPAAVILAHGGEQQITPEQWQDLIAIAPTKPMTHWRSVKEKLQKVLL